MPVPPMNLGIARDDEEGEMGLTVARVGVAARAIISYHRGG